MDYLKLIEEKQSEYAGMYERMDSDAAMFHTRPYQMLGVDGKKINKAYHITLLDASQFLDKTTTRITSVKRQVLVEAEKLSGEKTAIIENFLTDLQFEIDSRLCDSGERDSYTQHSELVCARGPIVEQNLLRVEGGQLVPDSRPIDARWFTYELSGGKMLWGCVESMRSAADIENEFGCQVSGKSASVLDFWNEKMELIYVDRRLVAERANGYGYPPFVMAFPATSSAIRDADYYMRLGDSIMHSLRTADSKYLFDEKNFVASVLKTLASKSIAPDLQFPSPADGDYQKLPQEYPAGTGVMLQTHEPVELIPRPDVSEAVKEYDIKIQGQIDRGTFSALDYGTIDMPLSAVAISRVMQGKDELLLPRLNALAALCQASARMKVRQFQRLGEKLDLGEYGHRRSYSPVDLDGEYIIKYRFYTSSQEQMAGAAAICNALGDHVSEEFKQDQILKLQDPAGMRAQIAAEKAVRDDPALEKYDQMCLFIKGQEAATDLGVKKDLDMKARITLDLLIGILKQRKINGGQGKPLNLAEKAKSPATQAVPMFAGGQGVNTV